MQQHLGRQSGVQKVQVSLIDGKVDITPKADGLIDPVQLLKATYDSGVSVAEMSIIAEGQIKKDPAGAISLQVRPSLSFVIDKNDQALELDGIAGSGTTVTIRGLLFKKPAGQKKQPIPASLTLTILEIQKKE